MSDLKLDTQQVEIVGRNLLVSSFVADDIEVAVPLRDEGVDLIAYKESQYPDDKFRAVPVQLKASSGKSFRLDERKYAGMLMAYVWHCVDPLAAEIYVMTFEQAKTIAIDNSPFFKKNRYVTINKPSKKLLEAVKPYKYKPGRLANLINEQ